MITGKIPRIAWMLLGNMGDMDSLDELIDDALNQARIEGAKSAQWELTRRLDLAADGLMEQARKFDPNMARTYGAHALYDHSKDLRKIDPSKLIGNVS